MEEKETYRVRSSGSGRSPLAGGHLAEVKGGFQVGSHDRLVIPLRVLQRWLPYIATRIVNCTAIVHSDVFKLT